MERKKYRFRRSLAKAAAATTDELTFTNDKVDVDYKIENLSLKNETNDSTKAEVLIAGHGYDHPLYEQKSPTADTLYWLDRELWLYPGERLIVRWTGCTAADKLAVYLSGYFQKRSGGNANYA